MITANTDTTPHNPSRITHGPPPSAATAPHPGTRARKAHAGRFHRLQQAALVQEPARHRPPLGRVLAEFSVLLLWAAIWLGNGALTAMGVMIVGGWVAQRGLLTSLDPQSWFVIGCFLHLTITAIEQNIWQVDYDIPETISERIRAFFEHADRLRLGIAVLVGSIDSLSTAWYSRRVIYQLIDTPLWGWNIAVALLAGIVALSAEPMLKNFAYKLRDLIRLYNR